MRESRTSGSVRAKAEWLSYSTNQALFPDPVLANSALGRLAHQAHHVVMEGESYRRKLGAALTRES